MTSLSPSNDHIDHMRMCIWLTKKIATNSLKKMFTNIANAKHFLWIAQPDYGWMDCTQTQTLIHVSIHTRKRLFLLLSFFVRFILQLLLCCSTVPPFMCCHCLKRALLKSFLKPKNWLVASLASIESVRKLNCMNKWILWYENGFFIQDICCFSFTLFYFFFLLVLLHYSVNHFLYSLRSICKLKCRIMVVFVYDAAL